MNRYTDFTQVNRNAALTCQEINVMETQIILCPHYFFVLQVQNVLPLVLLNPGMKKALDA